MYTIDNKHETVVINHDAGFFSVLTISLESILAYYRSESKLPATVRTRDSFKWYKNDRSQDLIRELFEQPNHREILTNQFPVLTASRDECQFSDYRLIYYNIISQIIEIYYRPSGRIREYAQQILTQIGVKKKRVLSLFYRGTDKALETNQPSFDELITKSSLIAKSRGIETFFVETDESALLLKAQSEFGIDNVYSVKRDRQRNYENIHLYLATIYAMSMTDYIVSTSGNGEMWIRLFRGHSGNTTQYLCPKEYIYGVKNPSYKSHGHSVWLGSNEA
jgi:hypothetical protein